MHHIPDIPSDDAEASSMDASLQKALEHVFQLARQHHRAGLLVQAESLYRSVLSIDPNHTVANHNLGVLAVQNQQPAAGLEYFQRALVGDLHRELFWLSYIDALILAGATETAQTVLDMGRKQGLQGHAMERLVQRLNATTPATAGPSPKAGQRPAKSPSQREMDKASQLYSQGQHAEMAAQAKSLVKRFPQHGFGWMMKGLVYDVKGEHEEALPYLKKAVELLPEQAKTHFFLGYTLQNMKRYAEAADCYRNALAVDPTYVLAINNLGVTLYKLGELEEAERVLRQCLALQPDSPQTNITMAMVMKFQDKLPEEIQAYRQVLRVQPDNLVAYCNLLFCLSHDVETNAEQLFAAHLAFAAQFEAPLRPSWQAHTNNKDPDRCLKIGFVSADLYNHAVSSFLEPVLVCLSNNPGYSLFAYYNNTIEDPMMERLRSYFAGWNFVEDMDDTELASKIRADGIDILFDLSGHTAGNRLLTFARKPTPIQVSWIGYPGTTGLTAMDYFLSDRFLTPPGFEAQFTEKLVLLPANGIFKPSEYASPVNTLPALDNGFLTFGSFNRANKINDATLALWCLLLQAVPDARMVLVGLSEENYVPLAKRFERNGIAQHRLTFFPRAVIGFYLRRHHLVDICLDTYPYGGGTTTFHAGWMGVPTLTVAGETLACRSGVSIMGRWGLVEFAANGIEDFVAKGIYWSQHLDDLAAIRLSMRQRFDDYGLSNTEALVDELDTAMRTMWKRWCAGLPAEAFEVISQNPVVATDRQVNAQ